MTRFRFFHHLLSIISILFWKLDWNQFRQISPLFLTLWDYKIASNVQLILVWIDLKLPSVLSRQIFKLVWRRLFITLSLSLSLSAYRTQNLFDGHFLFSIFTKPLLCIFTVCFFCCLEMLVLFRFAFLYFRSIFLRGKPDLLPYPSFLPLLTERPTIAADPTSKRNKKMRRSEKREKPLEQYDGHSSVIECPNESPSIDNEHSFF